MSGPITRLPLIVVAAVTVIALAVADQAVDDPGTNRASASGPAGVAQIAEQVVSAALGPSARAGVWYCSEGTSQPGEIADHSIIVANPTEATVTARVSVFPATPVGSVLAAAQPVEVQLSVPAWSQSALRLADVVESRFTAALVEVDSGSAVVEQRVQGPTGFDVTPCATRPSSAWHFPAGSTRRDSRLVFTLFNPFPDRAVVKFSFSTDEGLREPQALRGVLVPARSLVVVNVTDLVPRFSSVATSVEALAGRVVAGRIQLFDGSEGLEGLTAGPGIPVPQTQWVFAGGPVDASSAQLIVLYNPNDEVADANVSIRTDASAPGGDLAPFEISLPPQQQVVLVFGDEGAYPLPPAPFSYRGADTQPAGAGFWAAVQVYNGVPIAAERVTAVSATAPFTGGSLAGGADAGIAAAEGSAAPARPATSGVTVTTGIAVTAGVSTTTRRHVVAGNRGESEMVVLTVVNPSPGSIARVTVSQVVDGRITPVGQLNPREVAPLGRLVVPLDRLVVDGDFYGLTVESTQPVVVARSLLDLTGSGMTLGNSIPVDPSGLDPSAF